VVEKKSIKLLHKYPAEAHISLLRLYLIGSHMNNRQKAGTCAQVLCAIYTHAVYAHIEHKFHLCFDLILQCLDCTTFVTNYDTFVLCLYSKVAFLKVICAYHSLNFEYFRAKLILKGVLTFWS
jgi:hypothetical protein